MTDDNANDPTGYKTLATHISDRKKIEFEARKRVEDRGGVIITSSTAIVTLIFTLTAILTGVKDDAAMLRSDFAAGFLIASLVVFVIATGIGIYVQNAPLQYLAADKDTLLSFPETQDRWSGSDMEAARLCAWIDIDGVFSLQEGTRVKANWLTIGLVAQAIAVFLLVVALYGELNARGIL